MGNENNNNIEQSTKSNNLPKVFLHGPPQFSTLLQPNPSHNFHIINPSSHPPIHEFISLNPHLASSISAIVITTLYPVNADLIRLLPSLRLVCASSAGTNHIDLSECRRRGIHVTSAGNLFSEEVADMAVALLIDVSRKISTADRFLRRQLLTASWDFPLGSKLTGKGGIIVNVGRGALIDEKELLRCLMEGEIGGAGLDVFENEPHVPKELFSLDNVVLSPHAAVLTSESVISIGQLVEQNLEAFFSNKPLITPVI